MNDLFSTKHIIAWLFVAAAAYAIGYGKNYVAGVKQP